MTHERIASYYGALLAKRPKLGIKKIRELIIKKFRLKFVARGAYSRVYSRPDLPFVIKFCSSELPVPGPRQRELKKVFLGYLYLSENRKFGIQRKVRIKKYSDRFLMTNALELFPIEKKFEKKHYNIFHRYDIHYENLGIIGKKIYVIDF